MPAVSESRFSPLYGLLWTLVRTDFKSRYHGSLQGFVWALTKPLAIFVVLMVVFSFVFGSEPDYSLKLILGLFLWDFFADATKTGITSLITKSYLLTKARLPSWVFVVASMSNAVITLVAFSAILLSYLVATGRPPTIGHIFLFGWYVLHFSAIVTGISLAGSVLFLKYRDLNQVWDVVTQAGFFVAPIIYPLRYSSGVGSQISLPVAAHTDHPVQSRRVGWMVPLRRFARISCSRPARPSSCSVAGCCSLDARTASPRTSRTYGSD